MLEYPEYPSVMSLVLNKTSLAEAALTLPAGSVALTVRLCPPSDRLPVVMVTVVPLAVAVPRTVIPSLS